MPTPTSYGTRADFGYLYDGEYEFLMETLLKRRLCPKQLEWKEKINRRIVNKIVVQRRGQR